ncbi:putative secreted protein [Granulibacter bethesdensis CGDNIH4]|nr:putative secreted protein [Granulibacter bethesdensis CGDNIH4]
MYGHATGMEIPMFSRYRAVPCFFTLSAIALLCLTAPCSAHATPDTCRQTIKDIDIGDSKEALKNVDTALMEADNRVLWEGGAPFYSNLDHGSKQVLQDEVISLCRRYPYLTLEKAADRGISHKTRSKGYEQAPGTPL